MAWFETRCLLLILLLAPLVRADDKTAAAPLIAIGGKIDFDKTGNAVAVHFTKDSSVLAADHYKIIGGLKSIKSLTLYNRCSLTDETIAHLAGLENLEKVQIDGAKLSDAAFKHLTGWKNLKQLTFFHLNWDKKQFNGSGLALLAQLEKFESFGIGGSTFNDEGMKAISQIKSLTRIELWHDLNTDAGTAHLQNLPSLKSLRLAPQFSTRITDASLPIVSQIKTLESLNLGESRFTHAGGLKHLKALSNLKELKLEQAEVSPADMELLKADLPSVKFTVLPPDEKQLQWIQKAFDKPGK